MRVTTVGILLLVASLLLGCQSSKNATGQTRVAGTPSTPSAATVSISVTDGAGKVVLSITGSGEKFKVKSSGADAGSIKLKDGKLKLYDAAGTQTGAVKLKDGDYSLRDASDAKIAKYAPKEGGYRLKDTAGAFLLKIKPKDDGIKVEDGKDALLAKGKISGMMLTLTDDKGKTLLTVTGCVEPKAAGILLYDKLSPVQRAALMLAPALLK